MELSHSEALHFSVSSCLQSLGNKENRTAQSWCIFIMSEWCESALDESALNKWWINVKLSLWSKLLTSFKLPPQRRNLPSSNSSSNRRSWPEFMAIVRRCSANIKCLPAQELTAQGVPGFLCHCVCPAIASLSRRQGSRPSPRKRIAKRQDGCQRSLYK